MIVLLTIRLRSYKANLTKEPLLLESFEYKNNAAHEHTKF